MGVTCVVESLLVWIVVLLAAVLMGLRLLRALRPPGASVEPSKRLCAGCGGCSHPKQVIEQNASEDKR